MVQKKLELIGIAILLCLHLVRHPAVASGRFDTVISGGRVIDPATNFDGNANVAIRDGTIVAVSNGAMTAKRTIDASGLIVVPGFIDLHAHTQHTAGQELQVLD